MLYLRTEFNPNMQTKFEKVKEKSEKIYGNGYIYNHHSWERNINKPCHAM